MGHEPLQAAILAWYDANGRDLPWRRTRDPYAILVSEVMAQQTQIARVLERYERWMARWPTARGARRRDAGGGPHRVGRPGLQPARAAAAGGLRDRRARRLARDSHGLRALPGVGPYTAAAVASFAFGERIAAVDTNVRRVAARLRADPAALLPADRHTRLEPGRDGARRARLHRPRAALRGVPGGAVVPVARAREPPRRGAARPAAAPRFEETDRWARGRIVAALAAGDRLPAQIAPERLERVLAGLERDGLIERDGSEVGLPGAPR